MNILVLETDADSFFKSAQTIEKNAPSGQWRYCKFIDGNKVLAIFETENNLKDCIQSHPDFFKYFLGLFSPKLETTFKLHQETSFSNFCVKLNSILIEGKAVYDLSAPQKWIWSEGDETNIPDKLFSFLDFN